MLKASPMRDKRISSPRRMSLVKRKSSELKGLKKLIPPGTEETSCPSLQGAGAGQAVKAFGNNQKSANDPIGHPKSPIPLMKAISRTTQAYGGVARNSCHGRHN